MDFEMSSIAEKRQTFRRLHETGCFVIPNPWDIGSARYLQQLGFKALATTSLGFAFAAGYPDGEVPLGMMLDHIAEIVESTDVPVNADFEGGFAHDPEGVADSVTLGVGTGVAGLSIEDYTGDKATPLYPFDQAVARIRAARAAIETIHAIQARTVPGARTWVAVAADASDELRRSVRVANAGLLARDQLVSGMTERARRITYGRCTGATQSALAGDEGISQPAVSQLLASSGGSAVAEAYRVLVEG
jgi:2-methylisocitrate lyase-like PEP mutase family enzyme